MLYTIQSFLRLMPMKKSMSLEQKTEQADNSDKLDEKLEIMSAALDRVLQHQKELDKTIGSLRKENSRLALKLLHNVKPC